MSNGDTAREMEAAWRRIERWLEQNLPQQFPPSSPESLFRPPATGEAIGELEAHLKLALPDQARVLLRLHDGGRDSSFPLPMRTTRTLMWRILPVDQIRESWDDLCRIAADVGPFEGTMRIRGPVEPVWWSPNWIPFADSATGDNVCLDMKPAAGGTAGQLIWYEHDFEERVVLYPSLLDWLRESADDLEAGEYVCLGGDSLYPKDEDPDAFGHGPARDVLKVAREARLPPFYSSGKFSSHEVLLESAERLRAEFAARPVALGEAVYVPASRDAARVFARADQVPPDAKVIDVRPFYELDDVVELEVAWVRGFFMPDGSLSLPSLFAVASKAKP